MKRTTFLIVLWILLHLSIVDLSFYLVSSGSSANLPALMFYNVLWAFIAITIGSTSRI